MLQSHGPKSGLRGADGSAGGSAVLDRCGTCVGGTTSLTACTSDCTGIYGGSATADACGVCDTDSTNDCHLGACPQVRSQIPHRDCSKRLHLAAYGLRFDVANGPCALQQWLDSCGVCDFNPANDCLKVHPNDCAGVGTKGVADSAQSAYDRCHVCITPGVNEAKKDACVDCADVAFGISRLDKCGTCDVDKNNDCSVGSTMACLLAMGDTANTVIATLSLPVIGCHSLAVYTVVLLLLLSFSVKITVSPMATVCKSSTVMYT